jgi:hypothetical protein
MKCPICNEFLRWENDFSYEDYGHEGDGIIGLYNCNNVDCMAKEIYIFMPLDNENENN